ncbi:MAG: DNA-3-methyladenine glycosylase 2 family protein [Nitrospinaceae bacterium]|nr:DNA-3-methyladenine glycosylase 2 family protein [Nitrospinaceae bacterium]MBT3433985.1 DNA-3-methyladenine glycosylase 2 family protein [Nitrospinaceae bacterium]MBT4095305.1 DNA-3-methyladenine glycosylase 2 family protein [Nitrospinaceae bacterium]MBT4431389.1 DNA-3-methyladenine glycosylase 2 family protein [Nitrospinaceae bacterium]MBT5369454.1 DNA-3-methyladenine glycosylase 2 family protein [Nitrospinaceae bacterium]
MGVLKAIIKPEGGFLFHESLIRYQHSDEELVNRYDGEVFRRVIETGGAEGKVGGGLALIEAREVGEGGEVEMTLCTLGRITKKTATAGEAALRHLFALDLDLEPFYAMARRDSVLAPIVNEFRGLRPVRYLTLLEGLVTAITTQQVNLTFGGRTRARMVKRWGEKLTLGGKVHYAFPHPERLARARLATLRGMQFSGRKAEYVICVAQAAAEGGLEGDDYRSLPLEEAVERLTRLRGVGRWTAEQALYRSLGRIEALAAGDLGVQKVVARYCFDLERVDETRAREATKHWAPWGALASAYLFAAWRAGIPSGAKGR